MLNGTLIKTSLVDYPRHVAATYFLSGCNIRCPYCYNTELVLNTLSIEDSFTLDAVYAHLEKRKNVLSGFVLSGGEPLVHSETLEIIKTVKEMGFKVKLDTNGLFPEKLAKLFERPDTTPDYIAVDIKTNPENYSLLQFKGNAKEILQETISILKTLPASKREFRTVLCPPLVAKKDIREMAKLIPKDSSWYFAKFRNENCLDISYNAVEPYTDSEVEKLVGYAKTYILNSELR